jgi:hypothetical protein
VNRPAAAARELTLLRRYRVVLGFFMFGLIVSGLTAFPLQRELEFLGSLRGLAHTPPAEAGNEFDRWTLTVRDGLQETYSRHPWIAYGTDWLAFAHVAIAVFFLGPFLDPVRNVWVLKAGLAACLMVPVLALACGPLRGIPVGWRLLDCSFGIVGAIPLCYCLRLTRRMLAVVPGG